MTPEKLERIISRRLERKFGVNTDDARAMAVDIRLAIDYNMDQEDGEDQGPRPAISNVGNQRANPPAEDTAPYPSSSSSSLPPSPAMQPLVSARKTPTPIILLDRHEVDAFTRDGRLPEKSQGVVIRLSEAQIEAADHAALERVKIAGGGQPDPEYWQAGELIRLIEMHAPASLEITPRGRNEKIRLVRNIRNVVSMKGVKLIYEHPQISTASHIDAKDASKAVGIGLYASVDFYQSMTELRITDAIDQVTKAAEQIFGIRQQEVASRTPVRHGELVTFDMAAPHEEERINLQRSGA